MKNRFNARYLFVVAAIALFASCKKDDTTSPTPQPTNPLYSSVLGKWNVTTTAGRIQGNVSSKIQSPLQLLSIEFLSDTTYIVVMNDNTVTTVTFKITDSTSITLPDFGTLSEIKVADGKMNFKLQYNGSNITLSANKAAEIALTDDTKLLCRTWYLHNTDSVYGDYEDGTDKITVLFSSAGTYLVQNYRQDTLINADIANWKWHPTKPKTILYWWDGDEPSDNDAVTITELTSTSLKMTETYIDGNDTETYNYVLTPYEHSGRVLQASMRKTVSSRHSNGHRLFGLHK
ncbi:MAG: hypothetical protein QM802_24380 [Agriterribacter sp.]